MSKDMHMISVEDAVRIVVENVEILEPQLVDIQDALGYSLAVDVISDIDMPPFNKSAMDGYALIAEDTSFAPVELEVIENISAGCLPKMNIKRGQASRIMTGAIVPETADAVIMVEDTESIEGANKVRILKQVKMGKNIAIRAEDMRQGQVVLKKGKALRPQEIGVLASVGVKDVQVIRSPSIGIIATGDELVEIDKKPDLGQIRNSNSFSLASQALQLVKDVEILGIAKDKKEDISSMICSGLKKDILILSGGVSMGDYDLVGEVLKGLGTHIYFDKVALRPGKPTLFGKNGDTVIFGLPGNPVATLVTFELFVYPAIRKMMGFNRYNRPLIKAVLKGDYQVRGKRKEYRPAFIEQEGERLQVSPVPWHGSADLLSMTIANCLLIVPDDLAKLNAGQLVDVIIMGD